MIETTGLRKCYGAVTAISGLDFSMAAGDYVSLMGESGAGKSTFLKLLGCLDQPTSGRYRLDGIEVGGLGEAELARIRNRRIGFIFQSSHFVDYLDIVDNVSLGSMYAQDALIDRDRAIALLERVGLGHRLTHLPGELSGGERQRAAAARALYASPRLILADEPTGNLDRRSAERVTGLFDELVDEGLAVLIVTHDAEVAARAHRHCRIHEGTVVE